MKLQDYLHYYMGCTYWTDNSEGHLNRHTIQYVIDMLNRGKNVQLHLRRLEDMSEEEIKEFIGWDKLVELYIQVKYERFKNGIHAYYSIDAGDQGVYRQCHSVAFHVLSPKEFHCLLQQHFDLFGLIDAGLAVDAKTITQE